MKYVLITINSILLCSALGLLFLICNPIPSFFLHRVPHSTNGMLLSQSDDIVTSTDTSHELLSPIQLSDLFANTNNTSINIQAEKIQPEEQTIQIASWLKAIGVITDSKGIKRLYIKDDNKQIVLKVRLDGTEESTIRLVHMSDSSYTISINNTLYTIRGETK